jgi:hypothetical protein
LQGRGRTEVIDGEGGGHGEFSVICEEQASVVYL